MKCESCLDWASTRIRAIVERVLKILVVKTRWGHMGEMSGFPLSAVLRDVRANSADIEEFAIPSRVPGLSPSTIGRRVLRAFGLSHENSSLAGGIWSDARHQIVAKKVLGRLRRSEDAVVLLPAGEDELCADFALADRQIKQRIFACVHQPPWWFRLNWRRLEDFESLRGIFCLTEVQAAYFRSVCSTPVHLIRHGVRHDFFCPPEDPSIRRGTRLLFVGQWLRDFETLATAMTHIWQHRPDVQLDCVVPRAVRHADAFRRLAMDSRVVWHAGLTDNALKELYQQADLLFLPVLDATANNAILEAMACGLPVISTEVGGIAEYLHREAGQLCAPSNAEAHADAVLDWLSNTTRRQHAGERARAFAIENFDWSEIGTKLLTIMTK